MAETQKDTVTSLSKLADKQLEAKKVLALQDIAKNLENIYTWMNEIDKVEWSDRIQWYLGLFKETFIDPKMKKK